MEESSVGIESFDFLYMPSTDVARDLVFYNDVLGAEIVFAIEAFGTRVAQVRLTDGGPRLLLAEHLEGEAPGQRLALYELTRPEADERLSGRIDFEPAR